MGRNPPAGLVSCYGDHTASTCCPVLVHNQKKKPTLCAERSSHSNLEMLWHSCNWMPQFFFFLSSTKRINNLENDTLFFMEVTLFVIWQSWRIITTTLGAAVFTNRGDQQTVLGSDHFHWFTDNEQAGKRNKQLLSSSLDGNLCRERGKPIFYIVRFWHKRRATAPALRNAPLSFRLFMDQMVEAGEIKTSRLRRPFKSSSGW